MSVGTFTLNVPSVPRRGEHIFIDGTAHGVRGVQWHVAPDRSGLTIHVLLAPLGSAP
jgi:hypothetical protein